MARWPVLRSAG